jgi:phage regulator Rha-like protein
MKKSPSPLLIPDEIVINKIYLIRGLKVMIDRDLAELFNVETKRLKESVRRNISRFPDDFMFQMSVNEFKNWRTQFASSNTDKIGLRYAPFCFTEHGVVMLASILNSDRAIQMNIQIVRIFNRLREMLLTHKDILLKLEILEKQVIKNNTDIAVVFEALKKLLSNPQKPREQIGFRK